MKGSEPRRGRAFAFLALLGVLALAEPAAARETGAPLQARLDRALSGSGVARDERGVFAIDLRDGHPVYGRNVAEPLRPASNEKLTVALAALDELGPGFRIETEVLGAGTVANGVWRGDLVLKGYGDPTLSRADLSTLARRVARQGIARVAGDVVADESFFDRRRVAPGWKPSYHREECAPLSALAVDGGLVSGRVAADPALAAARLFRGALTRAGLRIRGEARKGVAPADAVPLVGVLSPRLAPIVRRMNRKSDNFVAEVLLKQLGARELGVGSTAAGARVVTRVLRERGVPLAGVRIVDGSGLSRYDRLTARAVVALLVSAWSDPAIDDAFVLSLPLAGVNGTLEDRLESAPAHARVRAKTGTTARASALSGYVAGDYVFGILMNGTPVPTWSARRAQDRFVQVLAGA